MSTSTGGIDLNLGHPTMSEEEMLGDHLSVGDYFDYLHEEIEMGGTGDDEGLYELDSMVGTANYVIAKYREAFHPPRLDIHNAGAGYYNARDASRDAQASYYKRAKYAAMAGAAAVSLGLGLATWQTTPKDDRSKAAVNASPEPTAKAESVKNVHAHRARPHPPSGW